MKRNPYYRGLVILLIIIIFGTTGAGAFTGNPGIKKPPKEEAVYVRLLADGSVKNAYVVNNFELEEEGEFIDYGNYKEVQNLTTANSLAVNNQSITISAPKGKFSYQGILKTLELPWTVKIRYYLDGLPITPEKVPGTSGNLVISLNIEANLNTAKIFNDNYALQITMTFDTDLCSDIRAEGGSLALSGKNKVVNFMKLPGQNGQYKVSLKAENFVMDGIQISGVPLSLNFEMPAGDSLAAELTQLEDAIKEINTGAEDISQGTAGLKKGFAEFQSALKSLHTGMTELKNNFSLVIGNNSQLANVSAQITAALGDIENNFTFSDSLAEADLNDLASASAAVLPGINALAAGLAGLRDAFNQADAGIREQTGNPNSGLLEANETTIASLEQKISLLMADPVGNAAQIEELSTLILILTANTQLLSGLKTGISGNGTDNPGLAAAAAELAAGYTNFDAAVQNLVSMLTEAAAGMNQFKAGIEELTANYIEFHAGLETYLSGNTLIYEGITALNEGLKETAEGGNQLNKAISSLHAGMDEFTEGTGILQRETSDMDKKMEEEIESYLSRFTGKDFEPLSFTASENDNITLVQFIMLTDALNTEEEETPDPPETVKLTFWQRFLALFSKFY